MLQGRSRTLIIRELQRTNLDVNLAVNNLLSRDEEDGDDGDDEYDDGERPTRTNEYMCAYIRTYDLHAYTQTWQ